MIYLCFVIILFAGACSSNTGLNPMSSDASIVGEWAVMVGGEFFSDMEPTYQITINTKTETHRLYESQLQEGHLWDADFYLVNLDDLEFIHVINTSRHYGNQGDPRITVGFGVVKSYEIAKSDGTTESRLYTQADDEHLKHLQVDQEFKLYHNSNITFD